ncbi:hypothetical protein [Pelobium manganitolerans]|uniref:hypothetical protein n=1 Tax=Pelobium manganitolerans TaxID=1842495 RepID=UPI003FA37F74
MNFTEKELHSIKNALQYGILNSRDECETAEMTLILMKLEKYLAKYARGALCPECLQLTPMDELKMFGGFCEECSGAFDE